MSNPTAEKPEGAAAPPPKAKEPEPAKPSIADAIKKIFSSTDDTDESKQIARRRRFVMASVLGFLGVNFVMFLRFFLPRALYEPKTTFPIGYPSDFGFGVDTKFQNQYRIWVVRNTEGIFVISAICTHLGCTPDWKASENKFKCPCHGSGFYITGVNFEGPAPRPLERWAISEAEDGQVVVDKSKKFQKELGQWDNPDSFIKV
jgi:cytochrome b6-f complex iron-sulfur subunit